MNGFFREQVFAHSGSGEAHYVTQVPRGVATVAPHIVPYQLGVRCALAVDEAMEPLQLAAMSVRAIVVPAVVLYFHAEYHHIFSMDVQPRC